MDFISVLNDIYDCPEVFAEQRRHQHEGKPQEILNGQINLLAGTQPSFLAHMLPEEAWTMGFTARIIMIYSSKSIYKDLFEESEFEEGPHLKAFLIERLTAISNLLGRMGWTPEAVAIMRDWHKKGMPPVPEHSRLTSYTVRRTIHVLKLSMIAAISRTQSLAIDVEDICRARDWLLEAEQVMPDIFREMSQKSDSQVLSDLHFYMWGLWIKGKKPIHSSQLYFFLKNYLPVEKIPRVIETAERMSIIARIAGTTDQFVPKPKTEHGVE